MPALYGPQALPMVPRKLYDAARVPPPCASWVLSSEVWRSSRLLEYCTQQLSTIAGAFTWSNDNPRALVNAAAGNIVGPTFGPHSVVTIAMGLKFTATATRILVGHRTGTGTSNGYWYLQTNTSSRIQFLREGSTVYTDAVTGTPLTTAYGHFAYAWSGQTTCTMSHAYINGTEAAYGTRTDGAGLVASTGMPLVIGGFSDGTSRCNASIGYVHVWRRYLTRGEILAVADDPYMWFQPRRTPLARVPTIVVGKRIPVELLLRERHMIGV